MVHGQNGAHLSELLLRNKLEGYTQGKRRGLKMACRRRGYRRAPEKIRVILASLARTAWQVSQTVGRFTPISELGSS
jgi:hypothetical protein